MHSHLHSTKMIIQLRWFFTRIILLRYRDLNQQPSDSSLFGFVLPSLLEFRKWTVNGLYVIPCSNVISFVPFDSSFEKSSLGLKILFMDYPWRDEIQLDFLVCNCAWNFYLNSFFGTHWCWLDPLVMMLLRQTPRLHCNQKGGWGWADPVHLPHSSISVWTHVLSTVAVPIGPPFEYFGRPTWQSRLLGYFHHHKDVCSF